MFLSISRNFLRIKSEASILVDDVLYIAQKSSLHLWLKKNDFRTFNCLVDYIDTPSDSKSSPEYNFNDFSIFVHRLIYTYHLSSIR